jgi:hypothetical protein
MQVRVRYIFSHSYLRTQRLGQGITRRSSSSSQHRECLESLARTPRNYTSKWKCGVVGGPGCSGWEVRRVRGWAGWLTFHNARFYAHHAAPVGQGGHEGFVSHLNIHHTYKWVSELECSVRHKQTTALCPHSAHALTSSSRPGTPSRPYKKGTDHTWARCIGKPYIAGAINDERVQELSSGANTAARTVHKSCEIGA